MQERLDKILEKQNEMLIQLTRLASTVEENTRDIKYHIKRTDILEGRMQKIIYFLLLGAGSSAALFGKPVMQWLGLLV